MTTNTLVCGGTIGLRIGQPAHHEEESTFDAMTARLDRAAAQLDLDPGIYQTLRQPERQVTVVIPVLMDDGAIEVFTGHRVLHNTARGPGMLGTVCQRS